SIDELAEEIGISESTLVRFVRKLGYSGYQRFRIALATEAIGPALRVYESRIDSDADDIELVFGNAMSSLALTKEIIDRNIITQAAQMMSTAQRVYIFGLGGSNIVVQDAFHKFIRMGLNCVIAEDYHLQLMLASQSSKECVALLFSHTGTNMDTIAIAHELRARQCPIIVITTSERSSLARMATLMLPVAVASSGFVSEAFSARITQQVIIDVLYVALLRNLGPDAIKHLDAMRDVIANRKT
ncbi:MAG: MurR/RpiR family transcriptional regulator, partial [Sphaerochaetaceae bacterium]|nr:MurR/RpiR family transcriptional regulator [Sphaerochaetaceae bacterium]